MTEPSTKPYLTKPGPKPQTAIGVAGKTVADLYEGKLLCTAFIYSHERAVQIRKDLGWVEKPDQTYRYKDVNWLDLAKEFELIASAQKVEIDSAMFKDYAFYNFEPELYTGVDKIFAALNKRYLEPP